MTTQPTDAASSPHTTSGPRILVDYRGRWGLGDLLCSEPLIRGLAERHGPLAEIRWRGEPGNARYSPSFHGPADDTFTPSHVVQVELFDHLGLDRYAALEAMPSLVDHMCSYGGVTPCDRAPRLELGADEFALCDELAIAALPRPIVAICADGSDRYRGWPLERFAAVAEHARRRGATVLEVGARSRLGVGIDLVGALPIRATAAVLTACDLFVGNNSGLLHYAQAADIPCIGMFSLALPERFVHDRRLVIAVQRDDLACIDCMTRDFAGRNRRGCEAHNGGHEDAACIAGLATDRGIEAVDLVFDEYLVDCPVPRAEGRRARQFRLRTWASQAQRLLEFGHAEHAARRFDHIAALCRGGLRASDAAFERSIATRITAENLAN